MDACARLVGEELLEAVAEGLVYEGVAIADEEDAASLVGANVPADCRRSLSFS